VRRAAMNTLTSLALLSVACLAGPASATEGSSRWEWDGVAQVVAVGDVHGSPGNLIPILKSSGLLDGNLAWTGGASHLVGSSPRPRSQVAGCTWCWAITRR
jgi:hypothetical protein